MRKAGFGRDFGTVKTVKTYFSLSDPKRPYAPKRVSAKARALTDLRLYYTAYPAKRAFGEWERPEGAGAGFST